MIKVLFVCTGNICRSPMADAVFQRMVKEAGLSDQISVDSAGTSRYHVGEAPHRGTQAVLRKHDIPYNGRARQFVRNDLTEFDYVLAMDNSNMYDIDAKVNDSTTAEVAMFLSYAYDRGMVDILEVPDPWYDGRFDETYDLVTKGCRALLDTIQGK